MSALIACCILHISGDGDGVVPQLRGGELREAGSRVFILNH